MTRILRMAWAALPLLATARAADAGVDTAIAAANAAGHAVFLVVTQGDAPGIDLARAVTSEAQKIAPETSIVEMDRADKTNEAVVKRYRLETVPVPLILVIAPNGVAAAGARPHLVTGARLARMIPSPAKAAHLKALDGKKASILVVARESMPGRDAALKVAQEAVGALKGAAVVTSVDLDAEKEKGFVAELAVEPASQAPTTIVFNAKGQRTGTLEGTATVDAVVQAVSKEVQECCPGGRCK